MRRINTDVVVIGSSFSGSLTALILRKMDIDVILIDRQRHPRFAIGESSTPAADLVLAELCDRYDLPKLKLLAKYGTWREAHPDLRCGLKRGFSYFHHRPGTPFEPDSEHSNELLVTASASDEAGDTHWYRADVDGYFANEAVRSGVELLEDVEIDLLEQRGDWQISGTQDGAEFEIRCRFLIDSSGSGAVLPRHFSWDDASHELLTNSRAIYGHFEGIEPWYDILAATGGSVTDHPFNCDAAALHHILDGAWMWVLPFERGVTSVGLSLDRGRHPEVAGEPADEEFRRWIAGYPSVAAQLRDAVLVAPFEMMKRTGRMQRLFCMPPCQSVKSWTLLPGTTGIVDPFFSTGIAHSLLGVERVAAAFEERANPVCFLDLIARHLATTVMELRLIDRLVTAAYRTFGLHPSLLNSVSMLYFAAATTWERRRVEKLPSRSDAFLLADDPTWCAVIDETVADLVALTADSWIEQSDVAMFAERIATSIGPYNHVGLCDPDAKNMYRYTAAPHT